jgi:hypothetical protein
MEGSAPGHPEISARNRTFSALAAAAGFTEGEVHRVLTGKVFPRQAEVSTVAQWAERQASP